MFQSIKQFLLRNSTAKQTVIKNTFWLVSSEAISRILKIALIVYGARTLGASGWGVFSYAFSVGSVIMIFSDIGLGNLITREIVQKKDSYKSFITAAFFLKGLLLLTSVSLVIFLSKFVSSIPEANILFPIMGAIFLFDSLRDLGFSINRASEKMEREMTVKTIMSVVVLVLGFVLLIKSPITTSIATAYAVGGVIGFLIILILIRKEISGLVSKLEFKQVLIVLQSVWPLALVALVSTLMANIDIYMLGMWKNSTEIGLYTSMQRIQQFIIIIPSMIATALFPLMSNLAFSDKQKFGYVLTKSISVLIVFGIPIVLGGIVLAKEIIGLLFGAGFIAAAPVLKILMLMLLIYFPFMVLSNVAFVYNDQRMLAKAYGVGLIVNILINIWLIPSMGAVGSAWAILVSTTITTLIVWNKIQKIQPFQFLPKFSKVILANIITTLLVFLLNLVGVHLLINILLGAICYFGLLVLLKEPLIQEIRVVVNL